MDELDVIAEREADLMTEWLDSQMEARRRSITTR